MTSKQIRYWTAGISVASGILALGDKVIVIKELPGWLTSAWPFVLAGAAIFNNVAHILIAPDSEPKTYVCTGPTFSAAGNLTPDMSKPVEIPAFVDGQPAGTVTNFDPKTPGPIGSALPDPKAFRAPFGAPQKPSV